MFSRAHLLIEREYEKLHQHQPWGIEAAPLQDDSLFEWVAKIKGLKDSLWEGGIFRVYIKFDEHYNVRPPDVCFHTIPFHPNVDMITGRPCIDFLDDYSKWEEEYSLSFILVTIQNLLSNPNLESPVNLEASDMIMHSPHAYRQMVLDCVSASQRVEDHSKQQFYHESELPDHSKQQFYHKSELPAGVTTHSEIESRVRFATPTEETKTFIATSNKSTPAKITRLSFDDYHTTWSGIATSKPAHQMKNPLLEMIKDSTVLQKAHLGLPQEEIEEQMKRQIEEHSALMYGNFKTKPNAIDEKAAKMARLSKMKKIYLPPRLSPTPSTNPPPTGHKDEPWEKEVEDLVTWSSKLDTAALDE